MGGRPLHALALTNRCVVLCDLTTWTGPDAPAWELVGGSEEDAGRRFAHLLDVRGVRHVSDFGGVAETFLRAGERYVADPPRVQGRAGIFSFTPGKRIAAEGLEMARVSRAAGFEVLALTVQKHRAFGKVRVLRAALRSLSGGPLTYYEDTAAIVDGLKRSPEADRVLAVHVRSPRFADQVARLADRVVSQEEYRREVLG